MNPLAFLKRRRASAPLSLEDAASTVTIVEECPACPIVTLPPETMSAPERNPFLGQSAIAATIRRTRLKKVVLDRDTMTVMQSGRPITETAYLQNPAAIAALRDAPTRRALPPLRGVIAACFDHWDQNYYHWLAHTIPTLHSLRDVPDSTGKVILPAHLKPWQRATLELLDIPTQNQPMIDYGQQCAIQTLDYTDYVRGVADFAVSPRSREAYERVARAAGAKKSLGRRLYIRRDGVTNRKTPNEAKLIERLAARGFDCIHPERLTLREQIVLFREAHLVVGLLGAGMANIAWCTPKTIIYELVPSHHINPCFAIMATQGGLSYWADVIETGIDEPSHETAATVPLDIDAICARLDELEQIAE